MVSVDEPWKLVWSIWIPNDSAQLNLVRIKIRVLTLFLWLALLCLIDTSRPLNRDEEFITYNQMDREEMEREIEAGSFLEHGLYGEHLYGTKLDSVRRVIQSSKMCVLDVEPTVCTHWSASIWMHWIV